MKTDSADTTSTLSDIISPKVIGMCGAMALVLYYLVPVTVPLLSFSPHVLAVAAGFLLVLAQRPCDAQRHEYIIPMSFFGIALFSILSAPAPPVTEILRAWLISLMAFWLMRNSFGILPRSGVNTGVQILLGLWSVAAISQARWGGGAYVSNWFGLPPQIGYATGLSSFSAHGAILMMPLLVWTLAFNLDQPSWRRSLLWFAGCMAVYFTMSRAGWLALLVAMLVLALRLRGQPGKMRGLVLHAAIGLLAVCLAWVAPTRVDLHEPGGQYSADRWEPLNLVIAPTRTDPYEPDGQYSADRWEPLNLVIAPTRTDPYEPDGQYSADRSEALNLGEDFSSRTRLVTIQVAAKAVTEYPWTGIGLGRFPEYYAKHHAEYLTGGTIDPNPKMAAHNSYAQLVAELGIPASIALLLWLGWLLRLAAKSTDPASLALHASIVGIAIFRLFHDGMYDRQLWIMLGCATALQPKLLALRKGER